MRVIFIYPDVISNNINWRGAYYHGIGYLSAFLKQAGYEVRLVHLIKNLDKDNFLKLICKHISNKTNNIFAFSSTSNQFPVVIEKSKWLKKEFNNLIICGGVQVTLNPEISISIESMDIICIGEGEQAIVELCNAVDQENSYFNIKNLWVKKGKNVIKNELRPLIDIKNLLFPDREIFNYKNLHNEAEGKASVLASRGCPFKCSYCCNASLAAIYKNLGQYVRFRSIDNIIDELKDILNKYPYIKEFIFEDDILFLNWKWSSNFFLRYKEEIHRPCVLNVHPLLINKNMVSVLKHSGCSEIRVGIESGNEKIRNQLLNRRFSNEKLKEALFLSKDIGIPIYTYNMIGFPGETTKEILDTVKLNAQIYPKTSQCSIFYPYNKTEIYEFCKKNKLIGKNYLLNYFDDTILRFTSIKRNEIKFFCRYFYFIVLLYYNLFRIKPNSIQKIVIKLTDCILTSIITKLLIYPFCNFLRSKIISNRKIERFVRHKIIYRLEDIAARKSTINNNK